MRIDLSRRLSLVLTALALLLCITSPGWLHAQSASGAAINGTVTDSSGAIIPGAIVTLTNPATDIQQSAPTNHHGVYVFLNIHPGIYDIAVSKAGFETTVQPGVQLYVNQTTTFDFHLTVGSSTETVTVEAAGTQLETSTAELGSTVDSREVNSLPLNGRNFTQLLTLSAGASPVNVSQNSGGWGSNPLGSYSFPAINGQRNRSNLFLLDSTNDFSSYVSTYAVAPIVDAVQEFKVQSHNDEAQFGGVLGGIVNVVTKSGTDQFHGDVWEFMRNSNLDARDYFASSSGLHQNQFGATIGGPVLLPRYNGRKKTFFFFAYEGFRNAAPAESLYIVPTAQQLGGDFSALSSTIYDPYTTVTGEDGINQRTAYKNNQIPSAEMNAVAVAYAKAYFPSPIDTGVAGYNGRDLTANRQQQDEWSARVDQKIGDKDSFFFRDSWLKEPQTGSGGFTGLIYDDSMNNYQLSFNWTHMFNANTIAQFSFGRNVVNETSVTKYSNTSADLAGSFVPSMVNFDSTAGGTLIPQMIVSGYLSGGEGSAIQGWSDVFDYRGDISFLRGKHLIKAGANFVTNDSRSTNNFAEESFSSYETSNLADSTGGDALASFLIGVSDTAERSAVLSRLNGNWVNGVYVEDQWKVTNRLTANLGLRWDVTLTEPYGYGTFNYNDGTYELRHNFPTCTDTQGAPCIPGGTLPSYVSVSKNNRLIQNTYDNIQPRVGLAYRLNDRLVFRAGYGRFFDNWAAVNQILINVVSTWPSLGVEAMSNENSTVPTRLINDPLALGAGVQYYPNAAPTSTCQCPDPDWKDAISDQWNVGIQQQLGDRIIWTTNYVGSHNHRESLGGQYNTALTPGPGSYRTRNLFPDLIETSYDRSVGYSSYNALQTTLERKAGTGLSYLVAYTWSKNLDVCGEFFEQGCSPQDPYNLAAEHAVSESDLRNMLSVSVVYDLPFGTGRMWTPPNKVVNAIVGGWSLNSIVQIQSGQPFYVGISGDIANTGNRGNGGFTGFYERLNLTGKPLYPKHQTPQAWFNLDAFSTPAPYTYGDEPRNLLRGDWYRNADLSLFRMFPLHITEATRLEFRAEAFNLFNNAVMGIPDRNAAHTTFGQVTSTLHSARQLQVAAKIYF